MPGVGPTVTSSPARRSFSQLKRYVTSYVQAPDDEEALDTAGFGINSAVDYLNTYNWNKLLISQEITTIADTSSYELDQNVKDPRLCEALDANSNPQYRLDYLPLRSFLECRWPISGAGDPELYALDYNNRALLLNVSPSATWVARYPLLKLWAYHRFDKMVDDDDTIGIAPAEFELFLGWYGRCEMALVRGRNGQAEYADRQWRDALRRLRADDSNTMTDWVA